MRWCIAADECRAWRATSEGYDGVLRRTNVGTWRATSERCGVVFECGLLRRGTPRPYTRPIMGPMFVARHVPTLVR
ncbi:MAG: hypothetical protein HDS84_00690 [Bacteroidales bacterium]|nr:hypothetical protein [Bacteroidales bacterium]